MSAAAYHITVKGGKYLEALANADTIVFDKTGTLTHATPTVVQVVPFGTRTEDEVLQIAACLEEHYPHSMANAVVQAAAAKGIRHDEMHSEVQYVVAHGIASQIGGEKAVIGSQHFVFEDEGCCIPTSECGKFDALPPEYSHLYLAIGGVLAGVICIADPLREEASEVLKQLRGLGIRKAVMMTGDNDRTASVIAKQVGVDSYYAEVLPEDKANFVEQEKAAGHTVIMLGDGINDYPRPVRRRRRHCHQRRRGHCPGNRRRHDCRRQPARAGALEVHRQRPAEAHQEQLPLYHELQ